METGIDIYYIDTIEQVKAAEDFPYTVNEYGSRKQYKESIDQVRSRMWATVSNVLNDLVTIDPSKSHYYMDIKILNSDGGILEKYKCGTRQPVEPKEPETPVEEG
jgi:hypothetical protein